MMRKISTVVDEGLLRRAERESLRQGKRLSQVLNEALEAYLTRHPRPMPRAGVAIKSFGAIPLPRRKVQRILRHEEDFLGS